MHDNAAFPYPVKIATPVSPAAMTPTDITALIEAGLPGAQVQVRSDDDTHFEALIVSPAFRGRSRVARHRLVYAAMGDRMREEVHALSMTTLTPEEAASNG